MISMESLAKKRVKATLPPQHGKGWTVLLECGHTLYDIRSTRRPKSVKCTVCEREKR